MHYLLGLAALVIGAVIATRRTRPTWFVVTTCVLVGIGALLAILSYTRVTDPLGLVANNILGWTFFALALMTMLSAIFVLERRGEHGEELPPLIGDNPFDGDTDDSDDPAPGTAAVAPGSAGAAQGSAGAAHGPAGAAQGATAAAQAAVLGGAATVGAAGAAASGSPGYATVGASGTEAFAEEAAGEPVYDVAEPAPITTEPAHDRIQPTDEAAAGAAAHDRRTTMQHDEHSAADEPTMPSGDAAMESGLRASFAAGGGDPGAHTDERPAEIADRPTASDGAEDGTAVVGADPDLATDPSETDVDAAPEGGAERDHGTEDDQRGTSRP